MSKFKYNLAVIGLGYVGLPLAIEAANSKLKVAGYDINESLVDSLNKPTSHVEDITDKVLQDAISKDLLTICLADKSSHCKKADAAACA